MIHGLSYPLEVWGPVAERLAKDGNRVVTFDLYGRGQSEWDGVELSTTLLAEQALAVMDHVGFRGGVNLVSLSTSDLITLWLAAMVPERIRRWQCWHPPVWTLDPGEDPSASPTDPGFVESAQP